jgi:hypothetical protein
MSTGPIPHHAPAFAQRLPHVDGRGVGPNSIGER